jgi:DNA-binding LytR/AlgR family response regulator
MAGMGTDREGLHRYFDATMAAPLVLWLRRPLIGAVPWTYRLRLYGFFLLFIALSSPFLHSHLGIALSAEELVVHTALVVVAVAIVMSLIEAVIAAWLRVGHRENWVSTGGFLLRAALAYLASTLAIGPLHQLSPFTRAIMQRHAQAGQASVSWQLLPLALLIVYVVYQLMRKDYLSRQVAALREINDELLMAQRERREHPQVQGETQEQTSAAITVQSNGVQIPLPAESILQIQADENYCHVVADVGSDVPSKRYLVRMTLSEALALLPEHLFLQTHRSHLVNFRYVAELIRDGRQRELRLTTGDRVPVSRARIGLVQSRIGEFLAADRRSKMTGRSGYLTTEGERAIGRTGPDGSSESVQSAPGR